MQTITKDFPLPTIQCGAMTGNGLLGATLWGQDNVLNITLGCARLWDHRGGLTWTPAQNFKAIRQALEKHDETKIKEIFASKKEGKATRPALLPLGRVIITLPKTCTLSRYEQPLLNGVSTIVYTTEDGQEKTIDVSADMTCIHGLNATGLPADAQVTLKSAWEIQDEEVKAGTCPTPDATLRELGFEPPQLLKKDNLQAFRQPRPNDPAYGLLLKRNDQEIAVELNDHMDSLETFAQTETIPFDQLQPQNEQWWKDYWNSVPTITMDSPELTEIYWHGMYKFAIMTNPAGVTPGLQGPWIEDNRIPPWSGDYHFNINVQLCNAPALKAGRYQNLKPVFELIFSWKDKLRHNAKCFAGIDDGYMLPHAVDDRGTCMGAFWTGNIDHACSAWMAQMMFDYCNYSGDTDYLKDKVFDFMKGVMNVFKVMIEPTDDGKLTLPVSISPEYRGADMNAWGHNSSFQLAAIHNLANNLTTAAEILHVTPDPFWKDVQDKLPKFSRYEENGHPEIGLWDGLALEESHRHHSHLGAICPFDVIDPDDPELAETIGNSIRRWTVRGMGQWTGWCLPWASQIRTRLGHADMATYLLETWKKCFTNRGGGSFHDALFPGFTLFSSFRGEIMQMDGAMGAVAAIQDLFAYSQNGVINVFRGIPKLWKNASFKGLHLPGGFIIGGHIQLGKTQELTITATRDQLLRLRLPDSPNLYMRKLTAGETITLTPDVLKVED